MEEIAGVVMSEGHVPSKPSFNGSSPTGGIDGEYFPTTMYC